MRPVHRLGLAVLAAALVSCVSTPVTLVALPAAAQGDARRWAGDAPGNSVLLRRVVLPGYLDSYPVVVARNGNALVVSKDAEWAEPLRDAVARVLRDALSQRLGATRLLIAGDGRRPDADLSVEFLALDPTRGMLRLDATWTFACTVPGAVGASGRTAFEVPLEGGHATDLAAATTTALTELADVLAARVECLCGKCSK